MRFYALAKRNFKDTYFDLISMGLVILLPPAFLLATLNMGKSNEFFTPANVTPGMLMFGFSLMSLGAAMLLAKDREKAFLVRLLTAPLSAKDFIMAYSLPYIPVAVFQFVSMYGIALLYGMELNAGIWLGFIVMFIMSLGFIGLGLILGTAFSYKTVSIAWLPVNLIMMASGAFGTVDTFGGGVQAVVKFFPFYHALNATRDVMVNGAGFTDILPDLYWVAGYAVVIIAAGIYLFKKKMTE
jgi:ABC-2 type transport system permease protein